jgi:hypothetical protein
MSSAAAQSRPEALIRYLLEGTSSQTGQEFFRALVHSVALAMDVAGAWVTEYLPERKVLRSLAFWMNGQYLQDYEYNIAERLANWSLRRRGLFTTRTESSNFSQTART